MRSLADFHKYQFRMVDWIIDNPTCALWAQPGLGKTVASLTALDRLIKEWMVHMTIVVAPLRVSQFVWPQEAALWSHLKHMKHIPLYWPGSDASKRAYAQIAGEVSKPHDNEDAREVVAREKHRDEIIYYHYIRWIKPLLERQAHFYVINQEQVALLARVLSKYWVFDNVFIDESSGFGDWSSIRVKAFRKVLHKITRIVELTGTPAANHIEKLYPQMFLLDKGERLGDTVTIFRKKYFYVGFDGFSRIPNGWAKNKETRLLERVCEHDDADAKIQIYRKVEDKCMSMMDGDYLNVPPLIPIPVEIHLPPKARSQYKKLQKDFLLCFDGDEVIKPKGAAALSNKMLQFCNGAVYLDGEMQNHGTDDEYFLKDDGIKGKQWKEVHHAKLDALGDIIAEAQGEPVLVAYNYKHDLQRILKRFKQVRTLDSLEVENQWNRKEIEVMAVHPASAAHGLNLQYGGCTNVWFGLTWNYEFYDQFNRRLRRQGQVHSVTSHHLIMKNSIEDQLVMPSLNAREMSMMDLLIFMRKEIVK